VQPLALARRELGDAALQQRSQPESLRNARGEWPVPVQSPRRIHLLADGAEEELGVGPIQARREEVGALAGIEVADVFPPERDRPPHLGPPRPR
jgi:hypothetical protein